MRQPSMVQKQEWDAADRWIAIVLMRQSGATFSEIGQQVGVSRSAVAQMYRKATRSRAARWVWLQRMVTFNERLNQRKAGVAAHA
jgi:transcriptional regulator